MDKTFYIDTLLSISSNLFFFKDFTSNLASSLTSNLAFNLGLLISSSLKLAIIKA